jgi:hypothetical protein
MNKWGIQHWVQCISSDWWNDMLTLPTWVLISSVSWIEGVDTCEYRQTDGIVWTLIDGHTYHYSYVPILLSWVYAFNWVWLELMICWRLFGNVRPGLFTICPWVWSEWLARQDGFLYLSTSGLLPLLHAISLKELTFMFECCLWIVLLCN